MTQLVQPDTNAQADRPLQLVYLGYVDAACRERHLTLVPAVYGLEAFCTAQIVATSPPSIVRDALNTANCDTCRQALAELYAPWRRQPRPVGQPSSEAP
jgi:hypothetical protein